MFRHKQRRHGNPNNKQFKCSYGQCDMKFWTNTELKTHQKTHSNVKPYQCDTCKKKFKVKKSLCTHNCEK